MKRRQIAQAVTAAFAVMGASYAGASGFQLLEQNASGLGNAYAGSAVVGENASTIFFNPAAMTKLQRLEVSGGINIIKPSYKFNNDGSSVAPAATGSEGGDAGDWAIVPNAYVSWAATPNVYLGLGLSAPFGLKTEYESDWVGRFQSTLFDIKTHNVNPSIAWRLNDKVSLGFGLNWQRMEAEYQRQAAVVNAFAQNTQVTLDADDDSWGWNAGALFTVSPTTQIGVSYRSEVEHELEGTLSSSNQLVAPNSDAKADITLPDTFILSVSQTLGDKWEMLGDLSWTRWSAIDDVDIVRTSGPQSGVVAQTLEARFRDTWRIALGANYKVNNAWKIKYGIAYDQTPVRNAETRLVSLPDNNRTWFSIGAQWKPTTASAVDFGAADLYIPETKIDNNQAAGGRGRVTGEYDGSVLILGVQYSQAF